MSQLTLKAPYTTSQSSLQAISSNMFIRDYLTGIPLQLANGQSIELSSISQRILDAQVQIETFLDIKLNKQIIQETRDFIYNDWISWNYIRTTYPVTKAFELTGTLTQGVQQVIYPKEWLSTARSNDGIYFRHIHLIGGYGQSTSNNSAVFNGVSPFLGSGLHHNIPNYWDIVYCTGFDIIPRDIVVAVSKLAAIQLLYVMGDAYYTPGISSQSISIDGLSQSTSNLASSQGGIFAGRIRAYTEELKIDVAQLRSKYKGFTSIVL